MRRRALMGSVSGIGSVADWEWNGVEVPPNNTYWYKTTDNQIFNIGNPDFLNTITSHTYENGKGVIVVTNSGLSTNRYIFNGKINIKTVIMPENMSSIAANTFENCTNLEDVYIGKASVNSYAFSGCQNMKRFVVSSKNSSYDSRNNCNGLIRKSSNGLVFGWGCTTKIPEGVTQTHGGAYLGITTIKSVEFPTTLTKIGGDTFKNCTNLKELRFNRTNAPTVDSGAFTNVSSGGKLYCPTGSTGYSNIKPSGWSIVYF